jgi:hypothetical protein
MMEKCTVGVFISYTYLAFQSEETGIPIFVSKTKLKRI